MELLQFMGLVFFYVVFALALFGLLVDFMKEYGPRLTLFVGLFTAIFVALATYICMPIFPVALTAVAFASSVSSFKFWYSRTRRAFIAQERQLNNVEIVGRERFDAINLNGDGIVIESEIDAALVSEKFSLIEEGVLDHIKGHMEHIGHAIDWLHISSPLSPAAVSLPTYGISREDFASYTQRFKAKYGAWVIE
jgi:hypothetical protein